jgi:predicted 3-demethylubiquinone-9 3-methyltransferase (glyoxalase superfamily)
MQTSFRIGETTVMASDGHCLQRPSFQGFSLALTVPNEAEAERLFTALRHGRRSLRRVMDDRRGAVRRLPRASMMTLPYCDTGSIERR